VVVGPTERSLKEVVELVPTLAPTRRTVYVTVVSSFDAVHTRSTRVDD